MICCSKTPSSSSLEVLVSAATSTNHFSPDLIIRIVVEGSNLSTSTDHVLLVRGVYHSSGGVTQADRASGGSAGCPGASSHTLGLEGDFLPCRTGHSTDCTQRYRGGVRIHLTTFPSGGSLLYSIVMYYTVL